MNTNTQVQVIFTIDKGLKNEAMKKARSFGLPFSSLLNLATRAFVDGKINVEIVDTPRFNDKTAREIRSALRDIKKGKNLSPAFNNVEDAIAYLKKI